MTSESTPYRTETYQMIKDGKPIESSFINSFGFQVACIMALSFYIPESDSIKDHLDAGEVVCSQLSDIRNSIQNDELTDTQKQIVDNWKSN